MSEDAANGLEHAKADPGEGNMKKFLQNGESPAKSDTPMPSLSKKGRLLIIVGTYSIGKERLCLGIARALNSKIYAPPAKQKICSSLEDTELTSRLTTDPRAAQVHMTPLFEIRAETLDDYLRDYRDTFTRAVGFRPTGWNYRPPNSRFVESPPVQTVLHGPNWRSGYTVKDMVPQRGSSRSATCFGVPYSEHSSFRELTMFCCALRIDRVIPTVNVGSAKSREMMRTWVERWNAEKKKNGLFKARDF
jgi:DNA cross-link repair 1A protein